MRIMGHATQVPRARGDLRVVLYCMQHICAYVQLWNTVVYSTGTVECLQLERKRFDWVHKREAHVQQLVYSSEEAYITVD